MLEILQYDFLVRGLIMGILIAIIAPLIGIFLVLRRYSLIADTLSHVSLAGVALGLFLSIHPLITALITSVASSIAIEKLRLSKKVYGESALSLFLSGSLAVALVLLSLAHGFRVNLFNYLFGSILTVTHTDLILVCTVGLFVILCIAICFKELLFITFDEETAQVGGLPTRFLNILLIILSAMTISVAIPIVGTLLIAALMVIPVVASLQLRKGFLPTLFYAEGISVVSVVSGIVISFYANIPAGGAIVLVNIACFLLLFVYSFSRNKRLS